MEGSRTVSEDVVFVRFNTGAYIARWNGKTASCTSSAEQAARRVVEKSLGDRPFELQKCGTQYAWQVIDHED